MHICMHANTFAFTPSAYHGHQCKNALSKTEKRFNHSWRNRGDHMGLGPPLLFLGGPGPPTFHFRIMSK